MPPKKGKGKGKKGKGKGKGKKVKTEPEPTLEHVDENTKQFFLIQVKDLEEKLNRYKFDFLLKLTTFFCFFDFK